MPSPSRYRTLLRLWLPTVAVGAVVIAVASTARGWAGFYGAVAGVVLVLAFFTLSHLVLAWTVQLPPELTLVIALGLYVAKVVALALGFVLLDRLGLLGDLLHRVSLGSSVIACTLAWTFAEVRGAITARIPTYDLGKRAA
ncbi:hypothetical protein BH20ACT6_BH20ACT6_00540 [soil metagenome]